jgi:hypothetical protein
MTFSPIISAAGTVPDSAGGGPDPAIAPDPGIGPGRQPAEPEPAYAGHEPGYANYETGHADYQTGHADYEPGRADYEPGRAAGARQEDEPGVPWPHQSFLELGALVTAAPCARLHTTLMLWEWQLGALVRTAALVVSELVSNAVQASADITGSRFAGQWAPGTPPVRVWLSADEHRLVIQVWDGSDRAPVPQPVAPEADCGRGLLLVGSLSSEWGCYTPEKSSGKVVWAVVTG